MDVKSIEVDRNFCPEQLLCTEEGGPVSPHIPYMLCGPEGISAHMHAQRHSSSDYTSSDQAV